MSSFWIFGKWRKFQKKVPDLQRRCSQLVAHGWTRTPLPPPLERGFAPGPAVVLVRVFSFLHWACGGEGGELFMVASGRPSAGRGPAGLRPAEGRPANYFEKSLFFWKFDIFDIRYFLYFRQISNIEYRHSIFFHSISNFDIANIGIRYRNKSIKSIIHHIEIRYSIINMIDFIEILSNPIKSYQGFIRLIKYLSSW